MACSPVILVVDDQEIVRLTIARILTDAGYVVLDAADGQEAADLLTAIEPALLITDSRMPRMSGEALIAAVRAKNPKLRILRVTACTDPQPGIITLPKPFTEEQLLDATRTLLADLPA